MALIKGLKSTTITKAFFLNAVASALIVVLAILIKSKFDNIFGKDNVKSIGLTFLITFIVSLLSYFTLFWLVGYGKGMLSE